MGTKNNPDGFDCYQAAHPDEPVFTLIASDPIASDLVELWAALRQHTEGPSGRVDEARATAYAMRRFARLGPEVIEREKVHEAIARGMVKSFDRPRERFDLAVGDRRVRITANEDRRRLLFERRSFEPRRHYQKFTGRRRRLTAKDRREYISERRNPLFGSYDRRKATGQILEDRRGFYQGRRDALAEPRRDSEPRRVRHPNANSNGQFRRLRAGIDRRAVKRRRRISDRRGFAGQDRVRRKGQQFNPRVAGFSRRKARKPRRLADRPR